MPVSLNDDQLAYLRDTKNSVKGTKCYDLELPWMNSGAIVWLNENIDSNHTCLEFGSGGSTLFFSKLAKQVDTYEADINWYNTLTTQNSKDNVNYTHVKNQKELLSCINRMQPNLYDICVVDIGASLKNRDREQIFFACIPKMKKTTIYVLDNGFSKFHYKNIWKWKLADFQKRLGNHYNLLDSCDDPKNKYCGTRILYPTNL